MFHRHLQWNWCLSLFVPVKTTYWWLLCKPVYTLEPWTVSPFSSLSCLSTACSLWDLSLIIKPSIHFYCFSFSILLGRKCSDLISSWASSLVTHVNFASETVRHKKKMVFGKSWQSPNKPKTFRGVKSVYYIKIGMSWIFEISLFPKANFTFF